MQFNINTVGCDLISLDAIDSKSEYDRVITRVKVTK